MTVGHLLYIPAILIVGLIVGYTLGQRAAERQAAEHNSRVERQGRRRRRRKRDPGGGEGEDGATSVRRMVPGGLNRTAMDEEGRRRRKPKPTRP